MVFKHFWNELGNDLLDVFNDSFVRGTLPAGRTLSAAYKGGPCLVTKSGDQ